MVKTTVVRVIMIFGLALVFAGAMALLWRANISDHDDVIEVLLLDGKTTVIDFEGFSLVPGGQYDYQIQLKNHNADMFDVNMEFAEIEGATHNTLQNFAYVRVVSGGADSL